MSKGKMTSVEVNEAKRIHEQMIDREWRRSISSGQDIERSEIAELMASDSDSTSEAEFCFEEDRKGFHEEVMKRLQAIRERIEKRTSYPKLLPTCSDAEDEQQRQDRSFLNRLFNKNSVQWKEFRESASPEMKQLFIDIVESNDHSIHPGILAL